VDYKRKARCEAIRDTQRGCTGEYTPAGTKGRIVARRAADKACLIKWDGKRGHYHHVGEDIRVIEG
jgi:hypothetical protein